MTCSLAAVVLVSLLAQPAPQRPCGHADQPTCSEWAQELADAAEEAAYDHHVPVTLLLAVAARESRLDPSAVGAAGEVGVWQLMPTSYWGQYAEVMCGIVPDACTAVQAHAAALVLRRERGRCGSWRGALSAYNTGHCDNEAGLRYARGVLREQRTMRKRGE